MACGKTRHDAISKAEILALRVIADRLEHGEAIPALMRSGWLIKRLGWITSNAVETWICRLCLRVS
jgi:hypothetical protein